MEEGRCLDLAGGEEDQEAATMENPGACPPDVQELYVELRVPLCRYLMALGLGRTEAEDVAQESFLRLCERMDGPAADKRQQAGNSDAALSNVKGWMFRVAHNLALDEHRRRKRRPTESLEASEIASPASTGVGHHEGATQIVDGRPSPEEILLERESDRRMRAALAKLPPQQKHCLQLRASGLKYREIAQVLDVGTSTVAEWVQKGLSALERALD